MRERHSGGVSPWCGLREVRRFRRRTVQEVSAHIAWRDVSRWQEEAALRSTVFQLLGIIVRNIEALGMGRGVFGVGLGVWKQLKLFMRSLIYHSLQLSSGWVRIYNISLLATQSNCICSLPSRFGNLTCLTTHNNEGELANFRQLRNAVMQAKNAILGAHEGRSRKALFICVVIFEGDPNREYRGLGQSSSPSMKPYPFTLSFQLQHVDLSIRIFFVLL